MSDLPSGWTETTTGALLNFVTSGSRGWARYYTEDGAPFIRVGNLKRGSIALDLSDLQRVSPPEGAEGSRTRVASNDILISITADLGRVALMEDVREAAFINQHVALARPAQAVNPRYLAWYMTSERVQRQWATQQRGVTKLGLGLDDIRSIDVPFPPSAEQDRIVAAIEEQFSRLDAAIAALRSAQIKLRSLQDQGILALVSGTGPRVPLGKVADIRLGRQRSPKNHTGPDMRPYLRAANITWSGLNLTDVKEMNFTLSELSTYALRSGDILVSEASGSASEVGKPAIWDGSIQDCCFQNTLLRLRSDRLTPGYLYYVLLALARRGTFARASKGVGIHHLSKSGLSALEVEVPSIALQEELVARIRAEQEHFSVLTSSVAAGLHRANRLRSSILAAAFAGKLVQQDPADEPASTLLARVAAERAEVNGQKHSRLPIFRTKVTA